MAEGPVEQLDDPLRPDAIRVRGARVHNLRDLDVDVPRDRLVVLTGVSGSGKSTLAFDTLHAEGQRRYIESLSSYARQFLDQLERPDVDLIEGLPPTVAIDQRSGAANSRSTVATLTEIHDYLRLLFARTGTPHCPDCGKPIRHQTPEQMIATVMALQQGRKLLLLAPLVRGRKGVHAEVFQAVRRAGLIRARVDGEVVDLGDQVPKLAKTKVHNIEAVVDRLVVREGIRPRLAESIDLALRLGDGTILLSLQTDGGWEDVPLSVNFACLDCGRSFEELEPRTFSFNSPYGACQTCSGMGTNSVFNPDLVVPDRSRSLGQGAIAPWTAEPDWVASFLKRHKLKRETPIEAWPSEVFHRFLLGDESTPGVFPDLERVAESARSARQKAAIESYRSPETCRDCGGTRLRPEARGVKVGGSSLPEVLGWPVTRSRPFFAGLSFPTMLEPVGLPLVREVDARLGFLEQVGLGYLSLDRRADTLSGGELQRVRLASRIGSRLVGACYVLDEPTAGLHPRDTGMLLESLTSLRDQGNSVLVVEHDEALIRAADWLIDLGPGAGAEGGRIVAQGPPAALVETGVSLTAEYLRCGETLLPDLTRIERSPGWINVREATERTLKAIDVAFPIGALTCVSGVSGSGKSTLVHEVIARRVRRFLEHRRPDARIEGLDALDKLIEVDQSPIGRGPRSTPSTATGVFDEIRKVFSRTREAKIRGYKASRFSFNVKGGRCEGCEGQGVRRIAMNFLADMFVRCDVCGGKRFNAQTLEVKFKGKSIGDVLEMRVDDALALFDAQPKVRPGLEALRDAGLGYLTLGQPSTTLSGGEAQRVKLAAELGRTATGRTLFLLDEPTTGLHFADVDRLIHVLRQLADAGNTVLVVEHNLALLKAADWLIDLGPEGGEGGGRVVAAGRPSEVAENPESATGRFLRSHPGITPNGSA